MHKKVKFKGSSGFMVECIFLSFNSHNSGNFHLIEENKISKSKLGSCLLKTKSILEIEQMVFYYCSLNPDLFGTPNMIFHKNYLQLIC